MSLHDSTTQPANHSPLGGSGVERWAHCPGSVELIRNLKLPPSDEPEYRKEGTAAHEAGAKCLAFSLDAWEVVGEVFNGVECDTKMADAVQVYLDAVRPQIAKAAPDTQVFIESHFKEPSVHPDYYGTADLAVLQKDDEGRLGLDLTDYKNGAGIVVEVEGNEQLMYYAYYYLLKFPDVTEVRLRIVQPNIDWHPDGRVREWETTADHVREWAQNVLIPAMLRTELDNALDPGDWCRFCPAKLVCPMLTHLFQAAATANPAEIINLNNASVGRSYQYIQGVKFYLKALEEEAMRRLNTGAEIEGIKLVHKKANRVYKDGADVFFKQRFGDDALTKPELKSPAQIAELGPEAAKLVTEWAYTPQSGLTVAFASDKRVAVKVQTTAETFAAGVEKLAAVEDDGLEIPAFLKRTKPS